MKLPMYQVDAFTNVQFKGNPAAVCPLPEWISDELMQKIAAENNLAETAFFVRNGSVFELRWFTPKDEVDLCGHATLAAAFVICTYIDSSITEIEFTTKSGLLKVTKNETIYSLEFPSRPGGKCAAPPELIKGLGKVPKEVYKARDYMAVYENEQEILELEPDMGELKKLDGLGVIVTAKGSAVDFVSRFFVPKVGIDEDPVTGSTHCTLVPYWKEVLGKNDLTALQVSERGGKLYCTDLGKTVKMSGEAVVYLEGYIFV